MKIEPIYEEIGLKTELKKLLGENKIEISSGVPSEDAAKILAISSHVTPTGEEVGEGQFTCGGRVIFCLAYQDAAGNLKKAECGTEFNSRVVAEGVTPACVSQTTMTVQRVTADKSGASVVIKAVVASETRFALAEKVKALSGGQGLVFRKSEKKMIKETRVKRAVYPVEEEFELGYGVGDVLLHEANVIVTAAQCGVGSVICDGEIILSLCLLQKIENSDILKDTRRIPFRLEAEADDAMPAFAANANAAVKGVKFNITVDEVTGKSTVAANVQVELDCAYYEESEKELVVDAYSPACEIKTSKSECRFTSPVADRVTDVRITARGVFGHTLDAGVRLMCCGLVGLNTTGVRAENSAVFVEGVLEATAFVRNADGSIDAVPLEAPFSAQIDFDIGDADYTVEGVVTDFFARIVSLESFDAEATVKFRVRTTATEHVSVLSEVEEGEEKKLNDSAISVYIPLAGEDLWDVAKRLNTCPDAITAMNGDLAYPLTGDERIVIYRQEKKEY